MTKKRKKPSKHPKSAKYQSIIREIPVLNLRADVPIRSMELGENLVIYEEHYPNIQEFARYTPATDDTFRDVLKGLSYTAVNVLFLSQMGVEEDVIISALSQLQVTLENFLSLDDEQFSIARTLLADGLSIREAIASALIL